MEAAGRQLADDLGASAVLAHSSVHRHKTSTAGILVQVPHLDRLPGSTLGRGRRRCPRWSSTGVHRLTVATPGYLRPGVQFMPQW